jgi:predicted DNA-binding transcriptional regulator AlpA
MPDTNQINAVCVKPFFLRTKDAARFMGVGVRTFQRRVAEGKYPQPLKDRERMTRFLYSELEETARIIAEKGEAGL